jgi:hypothetical protein
VPLNAAFKACGGWSGGRDTPDGQARFVLQGPRAAEEENRDKVLDLLRQMGVELSEDEWILPVFCCDEFQRADLMPLFFSEAELQRGWARSGKPEDEAMFLIPTVMDLRSLVLKPISAGLLSGVLRVCSQPGPRLEWVRYERVDECMRTLSSPKHHAWAHAARRRCTRVHFDRLSVAR